jgi:hypothetical protein
MQSRTSESIVTFHHSFSIGTAISDHPASSFRVVKEEELIEGLSFSAYRAVSISLQMPATGVPGASQQFIAVSSHDLDVALNADSQMLLSDAAIMSDHESMAERARNFDPTPTTVETSTRPSKETMPL